MRYFIFEKNSRVYIIAYNFFSQQIWVDKVHHGKAHKILYKKMCIVNLYKFFLGIAKILQDYLPSIFNHSKDLI